MPYNFWQPTNQRQHKVAVEEWVRSPNRTPSSHSCRLQCRATANETPRAQARAASLQPPSVTKILGELVDPSYAACIPAVLLDLVEATEGNMRAPIASTLAIAVAQCRSARGASMASLQEE